VRALTLGLLICCLPACGGPPADHGSAPTQVDSASAPAPAADKLPSVGNDVASASSAPAEATPPQPPEPPPDGDADGVSGAADLCPNSPYGEPVDSSGCKPRLAVPQQYTLQLTFENGSAKIIGDPRAALAEVAALITQYPETTVVVEGHTDDRGPSAYNLKMSRLRADAVARVLVNDLGIDADRVKTEGFGESKPIATNATHEGRERNRRVVTTVLPGPLPGLAVEAAPADPAATTGK